MTMKKFAVLGATGKIGHVLTEELLQKGHKVRAIGRDATRLENLKKKGADVYSADFYNTVQLTEAFAGCDAAFVMITPGYDADDINVHQDLSGKAIADALAKANVKKVVNLSSVGADRPDKTGLIKGLYRQEQRLNTLSNTDVLHLRPCYFMQNFFWSIPVIQHHGITSSAMKADLPFWMVSTHDIGKKAAEFLDKLSFSGKSVFELVGPQELSQNKATEIISKAIGRPEVKYVQSSYEEATKAMLGAGMKQSVVELMVEMQKGFNDGVIVQTQTLNAEHKGNTSFETFVKEEFVPAFNH